MKDESVNVCPKRRRTLFSRRGIGSDNRRALSSRRRLVLEQLETRELLTLPPSFLGDMRIELSLFNDLIVDGTSKSNHRTLSSYTVPLLSNPSEIWLIPRGQSIDTGGLITADERHFDENNSLAVAHGGYVGTADVFDNRFGFASLQSLTRIYNKNSPSAPSVGVGVAHASHTLLLTPLPNEKLPAGTPIAISVLAMLESIDRAACRLSGCHRDTAGSQLEIIADAKFVSPEGTKSFSFSRSASTAPEFFGFGAVNVETVVGTTATLELRNLIRGNLVLDDERRNSEVSLSAIHAIPIQNVVLAGGEIQWRSYEEGGGIEYTYFVLDELPSNAAPQIDLYWANGEDRTRRTSGRVATLRLTSDGRDADGKPMLEPGMHRVVIPHEDFFPGMRSPNRIPGVPFGDFLHAELSDGTMERIVRKHVASAVPPLVVNVLLHGWRPPFSGEWEDFTEQFRKIAAYYGGAEDWVEFEVGIGSGLAMPDSLLHHRVHSVAPQWESDTNFTWAVAALAASKLFESYAASSSTASPVALGLAKGLWEFANRMANGSRALAKAAAHRIADELIGGSLLQDRDKSNAIQRIQVIGHSRGAAVGAMVTEILAHRGYQNIVNFTSLDGASTDWPDGGGLVGDTNIAATAVAIEKFNYRVDLGITQLARDVFLDLFEAIPPARSLFEKLLENAGMTSYLLSLDLRAPERRGYHNEMLLMPDNSFTNHITITPAFLQSAAACGTSTYINRNWFGRRCGLAPAGEGEASSAGISSSAGEGEHGVGSHSGAARQVRPLIDGDFESLGELLRSLQDERDALDGTDEYLIAGYDFLLDASMQLAATWYTEGTPTVILDDAGTWARLRSGDSISQLVDYDKPLATITVRGKVPRIDQGSLEILLDDKPIRVIPFYRWQGEVNETIRVGDGMKSDGKIQVRVRGLNGTDVEVDLGAISVRAHHSWHRFSNPTDVNGDGMTNPLDALTVLNEIVRSGAGPLPPLGINTFPFVMYDVNDDGEITPIDALMVLNWLARQQVHGEGEGIREVSAETLWVSVGKDVSRTFSSADREDVEPGIGVTNGGSSREYPSRPIAQVGYYGHPEAAAYDELLSTTDSWHSESDDLDISLAEGDWDWIRTQLTW